MPVFQNWEVTAHNGLVCCVLNGDILLPVSGQILLHLNSFAQYTHIISQYQLLNSWWDVMEWPTYTVTFICWVFALESTVKTLLHITAVIIFYCQGQRSKKPYQQGLDDHIYPLIPQVITSWLTGYCIYTTSFNGVWVSSVHFVAGLTLSWIPVRADWF